MPSSRSLFVLGPRGCLIVQAVQPGGAWRSGLGASVVPAHASLHLLLGVSAADPFDSLLLTSDPDAQPCSKPNLFGEFLNSDSLATQPASFPSTHSAPPPACSTDFLQLGE